MNKLISERITDFLDALEGSLRLPSSQARGIVDEVRADLTAHIHKFVDAGHEESQAVGLAIEEMGPVDELAAQLRSVVPPLGSVAVRVLRRVVAVGVAVMLVWFFWELRAMDYGFSVVRALCCAAIGAPVLLLIVPDVIWRKNWMFTVLPTVVLFCVAIVTMGLGTSTETVVLQDASHQIDSLDIRNENSVSLLHYGILGMLILLSVYLWTQIQRRRQRLVAVVLTAMAVAVIEIPYKLEELRYAAQLQQLQTNLQAIKNQQGAFPSDDGFAGQSTASFVYCGSADGAQYSLFWNRPLNPGYAIAYSSDRHRMWIND